MEKQYLALVKGCWQGGKRRVDAPLLKNTLRSGERVVTVSEQGKSALSIFKPVTIYTNASLVEIDHAREHIIRRGAIPREVRGLRMPAIIRASHDLPTDAEEPLSCSDTVSWP